MAISVLDRSQGSTASGTSHAIPMPATVNAGDRLIVMVRSLVDFNSTPSGWNEVYEYTPGSMRTAFYYKDADGSEGGTSPSWGTASAGVVRYFVRRITGHNPSQAPEATVNDQGNSTAPDPPSITPSWDASVEETLFIIHHGNGGGRAINSVSTGYGNHAAEPDPNGLQHTAERLGTAATENPDAWSLQGTAAYCVTHTIAIRPASTVVVVVGSGGLVLGGSARVEKTLHLEGAGGVMFGGQATVEKRNVLLAVVGAGGLALGGQASTGLFHISTIASSGGLVLGGQVNPGKVKVILGSGGLVLGGTSTIENAPAPANPQPGVFIDFDADGDFNEAFEDVTSLVLSGLQTFTGRDYASQLTGKASAGKLSALLNNEDDRFSPFNESGPLFGMLKPGRLVTLNDASTVLWIGRLSSLRPEVAAGPYKMARLEAVGIMAEAANQEILPLVSDAGAKTGVLIREALTEAGLVTAGIADGDVTTGPFGTAGTSRVSLLAESRKLEEIEFGFLHEDQEQYRLLFHDRSHREALTTPQCVFSDDPADRLHYQRITEEDWIQQIFNRCVAGVSPYTLQDDAVLVTFPGPYVLGSGQSVDLIATYNQPVVEWTGHSRDASLIVDPPTVESITVTSFPTNVDTHPVQMPAVVNAGDLLIMLICLDDTGVPSDPVGWTRKKFNTQTTGNGLGCYVKIATGSEGGTTVDVINEDDPQKGCAQVYRISNWYGSVAVNVGFAITVEESEVVGPINDANPDPPVLEVPWGATPTLFIAVYGADDDDDVSAYPTGYNSGQTYTESDASADSASMASAWRTAEVASEDPAAFTIAAAEEWVAFTIAIRGPSDSPTVIVSSAPSGRLGSFTIAYDAGLGGTLQLHENIQVSGIALLEGSPSSAQADYTPSQDPLDGVGVRTYRTAARLFRNLTDAQTYADLVVARYGEAIPVMAISFEAYKDASYFRQAIERKVADRITLEAENNTGLGVSEDFFIEAVHRLFTNGVRSQQVTWLLSPASVTDP